MTLFTRNSISTLSTKTLWILFIAFHQINLVICDDLEEDNLKKALEAIERRQRDLELQEMEYYGQPENIGYGFQKTLGFFDGGGPVADLEGFESNSMTDTDLQNLLYNYEQGQRVGEKRKSNFRERMNNDRMNFVVGSDGADRDEFPQESMEYLQMLKNLWSKYRQSRNDDINPEDFSEEELESILNGLYERDGSEERSGGRYGAYEAIPIRNRKNYRVFEGLHDKAKRYPSFGEGLYGKKSYNSQFGGYESPSENDFPYSVKYVNPEVSKEEMETSRAMGFENFNDDKERDLVRILSGVVNRPKYSEYDDAPYWSKDQGNYDDEVWLQGPVTLSDDWYDAPGRNEKRLEMAPKYFKAHNGIQLNTKRFPVKRSSLRVRKEARTDKDTKEELKGIFAPAAASTTVVPPKKSKKGAEKKATTTALLQKQQEKKNVTKPAVTKHHEAKKVVRSAEKLKDRIVPVRQNEEIVNLFNGEGKSVRKKSIDWSQYFGIDKRGPSKNWLNDDYLARSESHFLGPVKKKRFYVGESESGPIYQAPFDTRRFSKKNYETDVGSSIDKVETKIGDIEEKIIDDALKYTGAHSDARGEDLNGVKGRVIQHLEAAYSLEKMKNALEEFKNLIRQGAGERSEPRFELKKSVTETPHSPPPSPSSQTTSSAAKENSNIEKPDVNARPSTENVKGGKTKKEEVKRREPENLEFLNEAAYPARQYDNEECPVLDQILHNCLRLEEIGGKYAELLVPLCSLQQLCYFCGAELGFSKMSMCDSMYLTEAQNICQESGECLMNARDSLVALRDLYEQDFNSKNNRRLLYGSCLANPCVRRHFLNSPGAIYSLEVQK